MVPPSFRCAGCGALVQAEPCPFRCPASRSGDDIDHVLVPEGAPHASWPDPPGPHASLNPFIRYRSLLSSWRLALSHGASDDEYLQVAIDLDRSIAGVDGAGFVETAFAPQPRLSAALGFAGGGELWVKDETRNVSGSHKARHLTGVMLYLLIAERVGLLSARPPLAIASCGNAALAAAVVARAAAWPIEVFVPPSAPDAVVRRLNDLDARVNTCDRRPGVSGDPCYLAFRHAVSRGAVPFCCQGSDNGLTIEGGETLAWEMIAALQGAALDAVFVQVGGGALASAIVKGFDEARRAGVITRLPAFHGVQTAGAYPLARAYQRLVELFPDASPARTPRPGSPASLAEGLAREHAPIDEGLAFARTHRSQFMWPWEREPRSIAHGILDDETYDWAAVVEGMLRSGGRPVVVSEERLREANERGRSATGINVDHTGSAGLAGLLEALSDDEALRHSRVAVIFSGAVRS